MKPSDRACLISAAGASFFTAMIAVGLQYMLNFFQMTTAWQHRGIWIFLGIVWLVLFGTGFQEMIKLEVLWRPDRDEEERRQR